MTPHPTLINKYRKCEVRHICGVCQLKFLKPFELQSNSLNTIIESIILLVKVQGKFIVVS